MTQSSLRFEILKLLKESPTHGYDLFIILQDEEMVKNASDLYKVLRKLKDEGIINEEKEESSSGPEKKILSLSKKGLIEYFERIIDSARDFMDLLMDINVKQNYFVDSVINNKNYTIPDLEGKKIYFNIQMLNPRMQVAIIKRILLPLNKEMSLFINEPSVNRKLFRAFERTKIGINFINKSMSLKPHSVDIILSDLFAFYENKELVKNEMDNLFNLLEAGGSFFIVLPGKNMREPPQMFNMIINQAFKDMPKEVLPKLGELFPEFAIHNKSNLLEKETLSPPVPNLKLIAELEEFIGNILKNSFKQVEKIEHGKSPLILIANDFILPKSSRFVL